MKMDYKNGREIWIYDSYNYFTFFKIVFIYARKSQLLVVKLYFNFHNNCKIVMVVKKQILTGILLF